MPPALRLSLALATLPVAIALCTALLVAPGQPDLGATVLASVAALLSLASGRLLLGSRVQSARLVLAFGVLLSGFLLLGVPFPPQTRTDAINALVLVLAMLAASAAALLANRRPAVGRILGAMLAIYGSLILVRLARHSVDAPKAMEGRAITLSQTFGIVLSVSWLIGAWTLWSPQDRSQSGSRVAAT